MDKPNLADSAGDAVPVVAYIEHHKGGDNLVWDHPGGKCSSLVRQFDHLAAMKALRKEDERLKADRSAQVAEVMRLVERACISARSSGVAAVIGGDCVKESFQEEAADKVAVEAAVRKLAGEA